MDLDQEILSRTVMQHMYVRAPLEQALGIDIFENPGRQAGCSTLSAGCSAALRWRGQMHMEADLEVYGELTDWTLSSCRIRGDGYIDALRPKILWAVNVLLI